MKKSKLREIWEEVQLITIAKAVVVLIFTLGSGAYAYVEHIDVPSYAYQHYYRVPFSIVALIFAGILLSRAVNLFQKSARFQSILEGAGLADFSQHDEKDEKSHDWSKCCDEILADAQNTKLKILGANGRDTFGNADAPLHELVGHFKGEIEVLLMHPSCDAFKSRTASLGEDAEQYLNHLRETLDFCAYLSNKTRNITVKLYSQTPIWKMLITNKYMWLQYYAPLKHVDNMPVYTFYSDEKGTSLFIPLVDVFRKRWVDDDSYLLDLTAYCDIPLQDRVAFLKNLPLATASKRVLYKDSAVLTASEPLGVSHQMRMIDSNPS